MATRSSRTVLKPGSGAKARASQAGASLREEVMNLKRERILQEAAALFTERGFLQTTVDAIAERLGATKPFVYYHFESKVDLLVEICERGTGDALAAIDEALEQEGAPFERFDRFVRAFTRMALKNHEFVAIYFREEFNLPREAVERIHSMRKSIDRKMRNVLAEGVASGDFEIDDPGMAALVIAGMSSYAFAWYREHGRLDMEKVTDYVAKMAMKMVRAPVARGRRAAIVSA